MQFSQRLQDIMNQGGDQRQIVAAVARAAADAGYTVADVDDSRPWGGFVRLAYGDGDRFVEEFFDGVDPVAARLGRPEAELSPKILVVAPHQRLSWQLHHRRAERWVFLNAGGYHKSLDANDMGECIEAQPGDSVQFESGECHRLVGATDHYTFVAEIWQHTDPEELSDEDDIVRLQDDYKR